MNHSIEDHDTPESLGSDIHSNGAMDDNASIDAGASQGGELALAQERLAYLAAEFENYKRQTARRIEEERFRAQRRLLEDLLPAIDNFGLARQYAAKATDVNQIKTGFDYVAQQMESALQNAGLEPIEAKGEMFDPTLHEAIEEVDAPGVPSGVVVEQTKRGFRFHGQMLRHSVVKVAK